MAKPAAKAYLLSRKSYASALEQTAYTRKLEAYAAASSMKESAALKRIRARTIRLRKDPYMMISWLEGAFLRLMVRATGAKRVLEVGCYTGYSAMAMAEALPAGGRVTTLDVDPVTSKMAREHWGYSVEGRKIRAVLGPALETLKRVRGTFDLAFIDADKVNYWNYFKAVLPKMRKGGLMLFDNTLWGGELWPPRDAGGRAVKAFNSKLVRDGRVEIVMNTIRDGVTMAWKR